MAARTMSSDSTDSVFDKFGEDSEDRSSADTDTTPSSELSPPDSPTSKSLTLTQTDDKRADARELAASLSLEEQVRRSSVVPSFHGIIFN
jgi:beta-glucosidase